MRNLMKYASASGAMAVLAGTAFARDNATRGTDFAVSPEELPATGGEYSPFVGQGCRNACRPLSRIAPTPCPSGTHQRGDRHQPPAARAIVARCAA
jgi:hypothetical protein